MINPKDVIRVVNSVISKNQECYSGISYSAQSKPSYNGNNNCLHVCRLNLEVCRDFYKKVNAAPENTFVCPFGMALIKKTYETQTKYENISLYTILDIKKKENLDSLLSGLSRDLKSKKIIVIQQLKEIKIDSDIALENHNFISGLIETLLIGRIAIAIQTISHQFFTPLQGAMSDIKNIEGKVDVEASSKRLVKNFNSLNKLATEIQLLLSTSEEFNTNMLRKVTVHNMVNDIFESLTSIANEKHLNFFHGYNHHTKTVEAIPGQLSIALSNIIQNAVKYSYTGHSGFPLNVSVTYEAEPKYLVIIVENEGCKITEEEIRDRLLFNLGYRGKYSSDRQRNGTGTGLYIANSIVHAHGGSIQIKSKYKGGSAEQNTDRYINRFSVYWPFYNN